MTMPSAAAALAASIAFPSMVFAVGNEHEHFVLVRFGTEGVGGLVDGVGERGALQFHPAGGHGVEEHFSGAVIERQRTLHKTFTGKDDKSDPVAL
jgi:hypothetical protein